MSAAAGRQTASRSLRLTAPAKINLGLRVVGRRADGYHLLESFFAPLDLADTLAVETREGARAVRLQLEGAGPDVPSDAQNLAVRAADAFLAEAGLDLAVALHLVKRVPSGGGLGGGSSDAAAVLRGLAQLHPNRVTPERLAALALTLGADVPFFLDPRPAWVSGIGEQIAPLAGVPGLCLLLANPGEAVATAAVFRAFAEGGGALTDQSAGPTMRPLLEALAALGLDSAAFARGLSGEGPVASSLESNRAGGQNEAAQRGAPRLENDLEAAAITLCPGISILQRELRALGPVHVGMSGSGATVFALFEGERAAAEALGRLEEKRGRGAVPDALWAEIAHTLPSPRDLQNG